MRPQGPPCGIVRDVSAVTSLRGDAAVAEVARRQYGVVTRAQLRACGLSAKAIATRVRQRRLHRLHRGVYAVGHAAWTPLQREMAAVLAVGDGAVLSHLSAAYVWGLAEDPGGPADVTLCGRDTGRQDVRGHRTRVLMPVDRTIRWGIPITTPARTVVDLAQYGGDLEQMVAEGRAMKLLTEDQLREALRRSRGRPGVGHLLALLDGEHGPAFTRSEAERRFLRLIRAAQLPAPRLNDRVGGFEVDFHWPAERVVVEVDGFAFHSSRRSFENDRVRDAALAARGVRVIRVTWRQLGDGPEAVIARLAAALALRAA